MDDKKRKQLSRSQILDKNLQLNPEDRLCPLYDCTSIKMYEAPHPGNEPDDMGFRVLDNCAEDNAK